MYDPYEGKRRCQRLVTEYWAREESSECEAVGDEQVKSRDTGKKDAAAILDDHEADVEEEDDEEEEDEVEETEETDTETVDADNEADEDANYETDHGEDANGEPNGANNEGEGESEEEEEEKEEPDADDFADDGINDRSTNGVRNNPRQLREANGIIDQLAQMNEHIQDKIVKLEEKLDNQTELYRNALQEIITLKSVNDDMTRQSDQMAIKLNQLERKQRERNLRLIGIPEVRGESCYEILVQILSPMDETGIIETAHRTGRKNGNRPRHIIFRVATVQQKYDILKFQRNLNNVGYTFVEDLTKKDLETKRSLQPEIEQAFLARRETMELPQWDIVYR